MRSAAIIKRRCLVIFIRFGTGDGIPPIAWEFRNDKTAPRSGRGQRPKSNFQRPRTERQAARWGRKYEARGTHGGKKMKTRLIVSAVAVLAAALVPISVLAAPGDLYKTDFGGSTIVKFAQDGTSSTFASGLNFAYRLAFD